MKHKLRFFAKLILAALCIGAISVGHASILLFEVDSASLTPAPLNVGWGFSWTIDQPYLNWDLALLNVSAEVNETIHFQLRKGANVQNAAVIDEADLTVTGSAISGRVSAFSGPGQLLPAGTYHLLVWATAAVDPTSSWAYGGTVNALAAGVHVPTDPGATSPNGFSFTPPPPSSAPLDLTDLVPGELGATAELTGTPEPGTFLLLGAGLLGVGMWRRRRANAR